MKTLARLLGAMTALALAGCMSTTPYWDAHFGDAARAATAQQVIDPDASQDTDPVAGIDGKSAKGTMDAYTKSYVKPMPTPNIFSIDVGGGTSSGQ